ncbi:MAG TPA: alkaline phosphatase D family protein [Rhizomicrobium sp.]|nr:alkaline phosphatase D family protein [Rhizomicrobium sp.]
MPSRREFLSTAAALGAALAWPSREARASTTRWTERRDLFPLGVASGDPAPESVLLWTRRESAMPLTVEIAQDEAFARVVATSLVTPRPENDWTVRVLAAGLKPRTTYWYRFSDAEGRGSRIGRTRTAPARDDDAPVTFAFVSCQNENLGANNAYRRMIFEDGAKPEAERLDFVLHLGDFIYELVWYPEDKKDYYDRAVRDIVRYPKGEKHENYHVPVDVDDYRAIYRAYLADPDLADARARFPFVCMWDNHEFSWQGWQSFENYGDGPFPAQTRKLAAAKAWFEYQPARVLQPGAADWNKFPDIKVVDAPITRFSDYGFGEEDNNRRAVGRLRMPRTLHFGRHVDLILTDNRSYRSQSVMDAKETDAFGDENFPYAFPLDVLEIIDAGKRYAGGNPPATIKFGGKDFPNWRKDSEAQTMLGQRQKAWFMGELASSQASWKIWGNSVATLDARIDYRNMGATPWPGKDFGTLTTDDWAGYRHERNEIFDFVKTGKITGFTVVAGDRHSFFAGLTSKALPPEAFEPVGVEFVTGSISAPGFLESLEHKLPDAHPLSAAFVTKDKRPAVNLTVKHGVAAGLALDKGEAAARAKSDPAVAPHLSFVDWGGHGYTVVRADGQALEAEFVCLPRPIARADGEDGGPIRYRVRHRAKLWTADQAPKLEQSVVEGDPGLSI